MLDPVSFLNFFGSLFPFTSTGLSQYQYKPFSFAMTLQWLKSLEEFLVDKFCVMCSNKIC